MDARELHQFGSPPKWPTRAPYGEIFFAHFIIFGIPEPQADTRQSELIIAVIFQRSPSKTKAILGLNAKKLANPVRAEIRQARMFQVQ